MTEVGRIREIVRYPVKSMAGIPLQSAHLGWYGLAGDRRFAFRRLGVQAGMPWLTAGRFPQLLLYQPTGADETSGEPLPTHVRTPAAAQLAIGSEELNADLSARFGSDVELMKLRHGVFDETPVSLIALATIEGIGREVGLELDRRRFRANIFLDTERKDVFHEDEWVGRTLRFGEGNAQPAVTVTMRDERCAMLNIDPDTAAQDARVMKTVVRRNQNTAGVYATVIRTGKIHVGDRVLLSD